MTNEELAVAINNGADELIPTLWEQVRKYAHMRASQASPRLAGAGVTVEDLEQQAFLSMLDAVRYFDSEKGSSFIGVFDTCLKTEFAAAGGYRTSRRNPLNESISLDAPVAGGEDGDTELTYLDTVRDGSAENAFEEVENGIYNDQLHAAIDAELDRLTPTRAEVIRATYWRGETQPTIAEELGCSGSNVHRLLREGIEDLRRGSSARRLKQFLDDEVDMYGGTGLGAFRRRGSAVEAAVVRRDELIAQWQEKRSTG